MSTKIDWQPFETAPRNGTHILAWYPFMNGAVVVYCDKGSSSEEPWWAGDYQYADEDFSHWAAIQPPEGI